MFFSKGDSLSSLIPCQCKLKMEGSENEASIVPRLSRGGARSDSFPGSVGDWDWPSLVPRLGTGTRLAWFPGWWGRVRMSLVLLTWEQYCFYPLYIVLSCDLLFNVRFTGRKSTASSICF